MAYRSGYWVSAERASPRVALILMILAYILASHFPQISDLIYLSLIVIAFIVALTMIAIYNNEKIRQENQ